MPEASQVAVTAKAECSRELRSGPSNISQVPTEALPLALWSSLPRVREGTPDRCCESLLQAGLPSANRWLRVPAGLEIEHWLVCLSESPPKGAGDIRWCRHSRMASSTALPSCPVVRPRGTLHHPYPLTAARRPSPPSPRRRRSGSPRHTGRWDGSVSHSRAGWCRGGPGVRALDVRISVRVGHQESRVDAIRGRVLSW